MFSQNNTIVKIGNHVSRKVGQFRKLARSKAILATAVAATGLSFAGNSFGALADVQSIQTHLSFGPTSSVSNVSGAGTGSGFTSGRHYNLNYGGQDLAITKITTNTATYVPTSIANTVVDRASGPDNDTIWYRASGAYNSSTLSFQSSKVTSIAQAFAGNNLLVGTDNLFTNQGNSQNNNTNIERLDLMFTSGFAADPSKVFTLFDRGVTNQHDGFKIAAITALSGGKPSNYGPLISVASGTWGKKDVVGTSEYIVTRRNDGSATDPQHPSDMVKQAIGGIVIPTSDLVSLPGQTIYGYSLFATDVTGSGTQLVDWTNTSHFPKITTEANGGLDAIGTAAVLFTAVPEPTTATLAAVGMVGLLNYRPRRRRA